MGYNWLWYYSSMFNLAWFSILIWLKWIMKYFNLNFLLTGFSKSVSNAIKHVIKHCYSSRVKCYSTSIWYFISIVIIFNFFSMIFNTSARCFFTGVWIRFSSSVDRWSVENQVRKIINYYDENEILEWCWITF